MNKIGLFLNGLLMNEYPNTEGAYQEVLKDFQFAVEETGEMHEVRFFNKDEYVKW